MSSNIVLVGQRSCGKSMVGAKLAAKIGASFVDIFDLIGIFEQPLQDWISENGARAYRERENHCLKRLSSLTQPFVLATGGGTVASQFEDLNADNWSMLHLFGPTVEIACSHEIEKTIQILSEREEKRDDGFMEIDEIRKLVTLRWNSYSMSTVSVCSEGLSSEILVEKIVNLIHGIG